MTVQFTQAEEAAFQQASSFEFADGEYKGALISAEVRILGQMRNKKLVLTYKISAPVDDAGRTFKHFLSLDNPKAFPYLKATLAKFGLPAYKMGLSEVGPRMHAVAQERPEVEFKLHTEGKYQNTDIVSVQRPIVDLPMDEF